MYFKEKQDCCDAKTEVKMKVYFTIILMMLCGIVTFLMALHINLQPVVQCMFATIFYDFTHLSDQQIKEFITAVSQMDCAVRTALCPLQVQYSYM